MALESGGLWTGSVSPARTLSPSPRQYGQRLSRILSALPTPGSSGSLQLSGPASWRLALLRSVWGMSYPSPDSSMSYPCHQAKLRTNHIREVRISLSIRRQRAQASSYIPPGLQEPPSHAADGRQISDEAGRRGKPYHSMSRDPARRGMVH